MVLGKTNGFTHVVRSATAVVAIKGSSLACLYFLYQYVGCRPFLFMPVVNRHLSTLRCKSSREFNDRGWFSAAKERENAERIFNIMTTSKTERVLYDQHVRYIDFVRLLIYHCHPPGVLIVVHKASLGRVVVHEGLTTAGATTACVVSYHTIHRHHGIYRESIPSSHRCT